MKLLRPLLAAALALCLTGCLYTSHHFNSGRVLAPGQTAVTLGQGTYKLYQALCPEPGWDWDLETDSTGTRRCYRTGSYIDSTGRFVTVVSDSADPRIRRETVPKFSLGYRLGVRGEWGPFTGVEIGWHLEAPTNPISAEFDMKLGLPAPARWRAAHSLSGGWIVGAWADNSFFAEYAASRGFGAEKGADTHALYAGYRLTYLATQPLDAVGEGALENTFAHRRRWANQASLGVHLRLPALLILPDFLSPQVTATTPWVPGLEDTDPGQTVLFDFNLGLGWRF